MTKRVMAVAGVLCLGTAVLAADDTPSAANWQTYVDGTNKVVLRSPAELMPIPGSETDFWGPKYNHHAFMLTAGGGGSNTAQQLCKGEADHILRPFGTNPTIRPLKVQGQTACLVWPSADQQKITGGDDKALVTVKYPEPVEVSGTVCPPGETSGHPCSCSFLMLYADKNYIMAMVRTLKFLSPDPQNAPLLMEIAFEDNKASDTSSTAGSPVILTVTLKNNSGQPLHFPFSDPTTDYRFGVTPLFPGGRMAVTGNYAELRRQHKTAEPLTLGPHASYQTKLEISSLYQLQNPGFYLIQSQMRLPAELGAGLVNSNTLSLTIVGSQGGEPQERRPHLELPPAASLQN